jgi:copper chaperone
MLTLTVPEMSCGHCVSTVTKAVETLDPAAVVTVDLAAKKVSIDSGFDAALLAGAIADAGYRNSPVAA